MQCMRSIVFTPALNPVFFMDFCSPLLWTYHLQSIKCDDNEIKIQFKSLMSALYYTVSKQTGYNARNTEVLNYRDALNAKWMYISQNKSESLPSVAGFTLKDHSSGKYLCDHS